MINYVGRRGMCRERRKMAAFKKKQKKPGHIYLLCYVHMCASYDVSVIKPVARRGVHRRRHRTTITTYVGDDRVGPLAFMPSEPIRGGCYI